MKLEYHVEDEIGTIVLSNPPQNTLLRPAFEDRSTLESFFDRRELKGVIIKGAGRHFSAGADLEELERLMSSDEARLEEELDQGKALLSVISFAPVPVVAAIRGSCLGAGLEIAMAAHFRISSENAILGFPESSLGLIPGLGGTAMTPEVLPPSVAIEMMLSGRMLDGPEALKLGLVDEVAKTRDLEARARKFLSNLVSRRPTHVIRAIMTAIHNARRLPRDEALLREGALFLEVARATSLARIDEDERN